LKNPKKLTLSFTRAPSVSCARTAPSPSVKKLLEVNLALRALAVELRYDPVLFDRVEVWQKGSFHGLARLANLHLNSQTFNGSNNYAR